MKATFLTPFSAPKNLAKESVYVPHHYMCYNLRPNLLLPDGTRHNHLGMRDHRDLSKKNGLIRVVFIGGSTTYTIEIRNNDKIFSYRLEKLLNEYYKDIFPDKKIQVINAGMGGATSAENLLRLIFLVSESSPDLVVIQHGLNDVQPRVQGSIQSDFSNYRKIWARPNYFAQVPISYGLLRNAVESSLLLTFISRKLGLIRVSSIGTMVKRRDLSESDSLLAVNSTKYFERNTKYMVVICKSMGAKVLLATEAYAERAGRARNAAMPEHNDILHKIAEEEGVLFYDFQNDMIKDHLHMPDGRHVSQEGSNLKADLFFSYFTEQDVIPSLIAE
jgi:lysophospholipase L1-like esterase